MESLTRLVTDSLVRHGFDRPIDPRRLQWSRWFRCDSPHSLLVVPSKPGIFALAEEIMPLSPSADHVGTDAFGSLPRAESRGPASEASASRVGRTLLSDSAVSIPSPARATQPGRETDSAPAPPHPDSGADKNLHCPHPLPSGF
jgi:hypothetical protein